jgi:hypothetical protein
VGHLHVNDALIPYPGTGLAVVVFFNDYAYLEHLYRSSRRCVYDACNINGLALAQGMHARSPGPQIFLARSMHG